MFWFIISNQHIIEIYGAVMNNMLKKLPKSSQLGLSDIQWILEDSTNQKSKLDFIQSLLRLYKIESFSHSVFNTDFIFGIITTTPPSELLSYYYSKVWQADKVLNFSVSPNLQVIDYFNDFKFKFIKEYSNTINNKISLVSAKVVLGKKHYFAFNIDREYFNQIKQTNHLFKLYSVIDSAISLIYSQIRIKRFFEIHHEDIPKRVIKDPVNNKTMLIISDLSVKEMEYLKILASGCTAKEIALHLHKSYRTVQNVIAALLKKLNVDTKEQLTLVAKIIL